MSTEGDVVAHDFVEVGLTLFDGGGAEQNPDDWWYAITTGFKRMLDQGLVSVDDIVAIAVTSQWAGTVAVDENGEHLMDGIIWMDARGAPYIRDVIGGPVRVQGYSPKKLQAWLRRSGGAPGASGKDPLGHIHFIKNERPDVYRATYKFLEPVDYLTMRFTGRFSASWDSIVAHFITDNRYINAIAYDPVLMAIAQVDVAKFPELLAPASVIGQITAEVADELGLPRSVRVVTGTGDMQSAAVGSGAIADYAGHVYIGTSSWVSCHVPFKKSDVLHNMASIPSAVPGKYFVANGTGTAGKCLEFFEENILYDNDGIFGGDRVDNIYSAFDASVESVPPGNDGVIFTPWLNGERSPVDDETVRGAFMNITLNTTRANLIRSIYEGVVFQERWLLSIVEKMCKRELDPLHFIGGGANSDVWSQIHADILGRRICQMVDPVLANVRGAAFLAASALGLADLADVSQRVAIKHTYEPNPDNKAVYDAIFDEFIGIYKNNRKMYARLNGKMFRLNGQ